MSEMLDVVSVEDKHGNPVLCDCLLDLGGVELQFKKGRAKVSAEDAATVARCAKLEVIGYDGPVDEPAPSVAAPLGIQKPTHVYDQHGRWVPFDSLDPRCREVLKT